MRPIIEFMMVVLFALCLVIGIGFLCLWMISGLIEINSNAINLIGNEFQKNQSDIICFESRPTEIINGTLYIGYNETCYEYKINGRYREIGEMI